MSISQTGGMPLSDPLVVSFLDSLSTRTQIELGGSVNIKLIAGYMTVAKKKTARQQVAGSARAKYFEEKYSNPSDSKTEDGVTAQPK